MLALQLKHAPVDFLTSSTVDAWYSEVRAAGLEFWSYPLWVEDRY